MHLYNSVNGKRPVVLLHLSDSDRVFASSPYLRISTFPQLGLLYLASVLRRSDYRVLYLDRAYDRIDPQTIRNLILNEDPLFIGIYSNIALRVDAMETIGWIRDVSPEVSILVGGPGHFESDQYFQAGATAVISGEADEIIGTIARRIEGGNDLRGIPGVRLPGTPPNGGLAPMPQDLDELPSPSWDLAPPGRFRNDLALIQKNPWYVLLASRGCPFRCAFCSHIYPEGVRRYRLRAPDRVIEEMRQLHQRYGVRHIKFQDDTFGGKRSWLYDFCDRLALEKPVLGWNCSSVPSVFRRDPEKALLSMKRAGCISLHFGLQSTSPAILEKIGRDPDEPRILSEIVPIMRRVGLYSLVDLIVGLPGESRQTIEGHLRYIRGLPVHMIQVFPLNIVPDTQLDREYPDGVVTDLTLKEIHKGVRRINRGYLARPSVIWRNLVFIIRFNPGFIWTMVRLVPYLITLGLGHHRMAVWRSELQRKRSATAIPLNGR